LPFVLISAGVAAGWVSTLDALTPYKWPFVALALGLLGYGFYAVYWKPKQQCAAGASCSSCGYGTGVRLGLWLGVILVASGIAFEYVEPWLAKS